MLNFIEFFFCLFILLLLCGSASELFLHSERKFLFMLQYVFIHREFLLGCLHLCSYVRLVYTFFLVQSLSIFGIKVVLANKLDAFYLFLFSQNSLYERGVVCSLKLWWFSLVMLWLVSWVKRDF